MKKTNGKLRQSKLNTRISRSSKQFLIQDMKQLNAAGPGKYTQGDVIEMGLELLRRQREGSLPKMPKIIARAS